MIESIATNIDDQFLNEQAAFRQAQERIARGGMIGSLIGRIQRWAHGDNMRQLTDESDITLLYPPVDPS